MIQGPKAGYVVCALCRTERRKSETRALPIQPGFESDGGIYFCAHTCWEQRGRFVGSKLGKGCLYWCEGTCTAGAQHTPCTLKVGHYRDCYIYKMHAGNSARLPR
jgi:hypothetical protein